MIDVLLYTSMLDDLYESTALQLAPALVRTSLWLPWVAPGTCNCLIRELAICFRRYHPLT